MKIFQLKTYTIDNFIGLWLYLSVILFIIFITSDLDKAERKKIMKEIKPILYKLSFN